MEDLGSCACQNEGSDTNVMSWWLGVVCVFNFEQTVTYDIHVGSCTSLSVIYYDTGNTLLSFVALVLRRESHGSMWSLFCMINRLWCVLVKCTGMCGR